MLEEKGPHQLKKLTEGLSSEMTGYPGFASKQSSKKKKKGKMLCGDLSRKEIQERRDTCIHAADSLCCTLETAAAAKSLQSCPTLCDPADDSPPGSPVPGTLEARTSRVQFSSVQSLSRV